MLGVRGMSTSRVMRKQEVRRSLLNGGSIAGGSSVAWVC